MPNSKRMLEAEELRYKKIQLLINTLLGDNYGEAAENLPSTFSVGKNIVIDGEIIKIGNRSFEPYQIKKFTMNTEGSMAIYDNYNKKLCGTFALNLSMNNIENLCIWVRKNNIPTEVTTGKKERFFQYLILSITVAVVVLIKIFK